MTTFSEWFRYIILPAVGTIAFGGLVYLTHQLMRDLLRKHRAYGGWNW